MVCLPLVVIVGLGWRLARHERHMAREGLRDLLSVRLQDSARVLDAFLEERARALLRLAEEVGRDPGAIREIVRRTPIVDQVFVVGADGVLRFPAPVGPMAPEERRFLSEYGDVVFQNWTTVGASDENAGAPASGGWIARYQGPGLNLLYFRRLASGELVGMLLERARWMAELIGELPDTDKSEFGNDGGALASRIRLVDSNGQSFYEWGLLEPGSEAKAARELAPRYPLSSWRLLHFVDDRAMAAQGRGAYFNLLSVLGATGIALLTAGFVFFREYHRQVREATQRVSFVNQVAHELKTPLTNIRMYAELLEEDIEQAGDGECGALKGRLKVIVEESQRLSRLIGNVLTFAQKQRGATALRLRPAVVDEVIASVIERFAPAFERDGLVVAFDGSAGDVVSLDVDLLEQVLGNLFSNVEKYAVSGKRIEVSSRREGEATEITVRDFGPGVPSRHLERVFQAFHRLSNDIAVSPGAGLGLTIARQLARLHGGDLRLVACEAGACFALHLHTPAVEGEVSR